MLKKIREEKKYSRLKLAEESGVHWRTIQEWELGGIGNAKACNLRKVADALGCSIDEILEGEKL